MSGLLVMKFGGTSMGSDERIRAAAQLSVEQNSRRPTVVVVSAMSKITDLLLDSMRRLCLTAAAGLGIVVSSLPSQPHPLRVPEEAHSPTAVRPAKLRPRRRR